MFGKNNDQQFYDQRAAEVQAAVAAGNTERAADLVAHLLIEEGSTGVSKVTEAINRRKN
jgi:hypothetical protein